jgi:hypothetical protein
LDQIQPGIGGAVETSENGFEVRRYLAGFVSTSLAAGPVERICRFDRKFAEFRGKTRSFSQ